MAYGRKRRSGNGYGRSRRRTGGRKRTRFYSMSRGGIRL